MSEKALNAYPIAELKLIYRVLHRALKGEPDLLDSELLADLQDHLHQAAQVAGVDPTDHAALDRWLGNADAVACEARFAN